MAANLTYDPKAPIIDKMRLKNYVSQKLDLKFSFQCSQSLT